MTTISPQTGKFVKGNNVAFPTFPDSANLELKIPAADQAAKPAQAQDLQQSDPGAPDGRLLERIIRVPIPAGHRCKLSLRLYYFWALLDAHQGDRESCSPSILRLALECRVSERQIKRWLAKLRRLRYIRVDWRGKRNRYRVNRSRNITTFVFVDPRWIHRLGLSINQACVLGYVSFRCNGKPESWFSLSEAALALGLCRRAIDMCLAVLAAWDFIEIRPGRKSGGRTNRYKLTVFGELTAGENYQHVPAQKCPLLRNTLPTVGHSYACFARNGRARSGFGLSSGCRPDREPYELLRSIGVHSKVARPMAIQWQDYPESINNAFLNAAYLAEADAETLRRHNLAPLRGSPNSYALGTLNGALSEGHRVKLSKLAEAGEAKRKGGARAAAGPGVTAVCHRAWVKEQIRRLKSAPARPHTPDNNAESAMTGRERDKKADDVFLTRTLEFARRNSRSYHKPANIAQKMGISAGPCC